MKYLTFVFGFFAGLCLMSCRFYIEAQELKVNGEPYHTISEIGDTISVQPYVASFTLSPWTMSLRPHSVRRQSAASVAARLTDSADTPKGESLLSFKSLNSLSSQFLPLKGPIDRWDGKNDCINPEAFKVKAVK